MCFLVYGLLFLSWLRGYNCFAQRQSGILPGANFSYIFFCEKWFSAENSVAFLGKQFFGNFFRGECQFFPTFFEGENFLQNFAQNFPRKNVRNIGPCKVCIKNFRCYKMARAFRRLFRGDRTELIILSRPNSNDGELFSLDECSDRLAKSRWGDWCYKSPKALIAR
jgi:hypothetical protein